LPDTQYFDFAAATNMEENNQEGSDPTQGTDDNEEAIM